MMVDKGIYQSFCISFVVVRFGCVLRCQHQRLSNSLPFLSGDDEVLLDDTWHFKFYVHDGLQERINDSFSVTVELSINRIELFLHPAGLLPHSFSFLLQFILLLLPLLILSLLYDVNSLLGRGLCILQIGFAFLLSSRDDKRRLLLSLEKILDTTVHSNY